tara:strand:+ start:2322 stop:2930 length:609 start_codon:yes stop_codon:yes gene_type:complete
MSLINKPEVSRLFRVYRVYFLKSAFIIFLLSIIFNELIIKLVKSYNPGKFFQKKHVEKENYNNLHLYKYDTGNSINTMFKKNKYNLGRYPNVEIKAGEEIFKHNKFLPECCMYYSDYSNDKGCPCITPEQQNYLQRRGLNRSSESFIHERDLKNIFFSPSNTLKGNKEEIFLSNNIYIKKDPEPLSVGDKNKVLSILNMQER